MSIEQRVIIHLTDNETSDKIGDLKISAEVSKELVRSRDVYFEDFETKTMEFKNVPRVKEPDNITPIEYCTKFDLGPGARIMLLEENSYQIRFDSQVEIEEERGDRIFPILKKEEDSGNLILERWRLDEEDKYTVRERLNFHSYVGKSFFDVEIGDMKSSPHPFEVRSKKIGYQDQYPAMISDLSEAAAGLIFEQEAPLYQEFDFDNRPRDTYYEDFMFLEYLFRPDELPQAYEYVLHHMYNRLEKYSEVKPIHSATSIGSNDLIEMVSNPENLSKSETLPKNWPQSMGNYVPTDVKMESTKESIDVPENRLLKNLLLSIDKLIFKLLNSKYGEQEGYIRDRLVEYQNKVQDYLSHDWVNEVSELKYVPSNSQVLQKREGYRDIFQYFINFNFAFRLQWQEMRDNLRGYNRCLHELYEYWCYFKMVRVLEEITGCKVDYKDLFETKEWMIEVKRGNKSRLPFQFEMEGEDVNMELMYNKTFSRNTREPSYSLPFRPDYTLHIFVDNEHHFVHFDAKYRSEGDVIEFYDKIGSENISKDEKKLEDDEKEAKERDEEEDIKKTYKNADIYKMHTYKDAILETQGAYILYPGDEDVVFRVEDDQPIPSVGAFPLTPGEDRGDIEGLERFILAILRTMVY
ncbi:MAG: DUF2357 domain-containing protein [Elusimicrobiota bacterium]